MSRSRRKTPIFGNASGPDSEKESKHYANRKQRSRSNQMIKESKDYEELNFPIEKEIFDMEWDGRKDGKYYKLNANEKDMRK